MHGPTAQALYCSFSGHQNNAQDGQADAQMSWKSSMLAYQGTHGVAGAGSVLFAGHGDS